MKILLATNGKSLESRKAKRFGRANYYLIFDSESKKLDVRINSGHNEGHSKLVDLTNEGVTDFVVGNIGPRAFEVLNKMNCKVYLARDNKAGDALKKIKNNVLIQLFKPTLKNSIEKH